MVTLYLKCIQMNKSNIRNLYPYFRHFSIDSIVNLVQFANGSAIDIQNHIDILANSTLHLTFTCI